MELTVRHARIEDIPRMQELFSAARAHMRAEGNLTQWKDYPSDALLKDDISKQQSYVILDGEDIAGTFVFMTGEEPTYAVIEDGAWLNDEPYGTIHRIASRGKGVFSAALEFCKSRCSHIRVDTHADNKPMQHLAEKHGFSRRGIIYVADGTPRIAYDLL